MEENTPLDSLSEQPVYVPEPIQPKVWLVLLIQICMCLFCALLGAGLVMGIAFALGWNTDNLMQGRLAIDAPVAERWQMRTYLGMSHLFTFTIAAWLTGWLCFRRLTSHGPGIADYFRLRPAPTALAIIQGILLLSVAMPFVMFSFEINQLVPLPDTLRDMEGSTEALIKGLLQMPHWTEFAGNLLVVAVLPAIGEELIFRGVVQRQLQRLMDPLMAILMTGIVFSAIHLQFEGFLPRMLLGMILGWMYWKTNSLWVPIAAHFVNNGLQVAAQYFMGDTVPLDMEKNVEVPIPYVLVSVGLTWLMVLWMRRK